MRFSLFTILVSICILSFSQNKQVCFTFDDLPVAALGSSSTVFQKTITSKLLNTFGEYDIPAIGFVNGRSLFVNNSIDSSKVDLLKMWLDSGMELGNHSYNHLDFHKVGCSTFFNDIVKGEMVIKPLTLSYGKSMQYFRHPFLHIGETRDKADSLHEFLIKAGYTEAPVTIDNSDYIFSVAYYKALKKNDTNLMLQIGATYVEYMEKKLQYYEELSMRLFGRNIRHILLLHANVINADYLDELAAMYQKNGYEFIPLSKALEDIAYKSEVKVYNNWGISWIDRWALSIGKKGEFFKDDPRTPEYILKLAEIYHE
jgi:peptidoglycan/xylan/chitin deacetylase (PgdA/CDA1 family)